MFDIGPEYDETSRQKHCELNFVIFLVRPNEYTLNSFVWGN